MTMDIQMTLDSHFDSFVTRQLASGRYRSEREVIIAGLMALEHAQAKVQALRMIQSEGGDHVVEYSFDQLIAEFNDFAA
ncbi:type II toxin-antitoxin system ParD family antitoxin [Motilimonas eburnea]|uniref:type II toxin-antitoxin system ParD family antitoxin n=1 Tax=Motilimonas eburnea TaxID=1737488 RepID=UPI001E645DBF|nr:type II toxin-antitoxin system ParD family antitoxin [Motilimonas eburnea]MCE2572341.1 type II toxin-antitoxin system ParD family antitoxin [Motilimonas eburnea]